MQLIYRLRLAAKKVEGDRDFQAQMNEEPAPSLFQIPTILSTLKEEREKNNNNKKKKKKDPSPEEEIESIVEKTVLEMKEEEKPKEEKAEEAGDQANEELSANPSEATFSPIPPADLSDEWW